MGAAKKGYNVFFNPYMGIGGTDATTHNDKVEVISAVTHPVEESWVEDLPWRGPAVGMLTKLTGDLEGIPLEVNSVVNKSGVVNKVNRPYPNTDKRRAYQREYMRGRRAVQDQKKWEGQ